MLVRYITSGVNSKPESKEWFIIEGQAFFVDSDDMLVCRGYHEDLLTVYIVIIVGAGFFL
jgi:hypothetical protein